MTAFDVDLDALHAAVDELAACHRDLLTLAAEVDREHERLQSGWAGVAARADAATYDGWRSECADMARSLELLHTIGSAAGERYRSAVDANLAAWRAVGR